MVIEPIQLTQLIAILSGSLIIPVLCIALLYRKPGTGEWGLGLLCLTLGYSVSPGAVLSDLISDQGIAMALVSAGLFFFLRSLKSMFGHHSDLRYMAIPVCLMLGSQWLFASSYQLSAVGSSLILGVQFLILAVTVLTDRISPLCKLRLILVFSALVPGVVYLLRATVYLLTNDTEYFMLGNTPLQVIALFSILVFLPLATLAVLFIRSPEVEAG